MHVLPWAVFATSGSKAAAEIEEGAVIRTFLGGTATFSSRVHVKIPPAFANGYSVPMTIAIDSPMTEADHVRVVHVLAPQNPIVPVASFQFTPQSGQAMLSTRIRLAMTQTVLAIAEMSDGSLLLGRAPVKVDINGCN